jgi:glycosyltransferase involved in cell wall biosynthesis
MRILLVNKYFHPAGGPETLLFDSMEKLESLGHTVIPFSMQHPKNVKSEYEKYFVSNVDYDNYSKLPWDMAKTAINFIFNLEAKKKMEQLIIDTKPDIAHLHNIYHQISPSILIPLKKHNIPVIMTLHDFKLVCPNYTFLRNEKTCEECQGKHFYKAIKYRCVKNSYLKSTISALEMYLHKVFGIYEKNADCFMVLSRFSQQRFIQYGIPQEKMFFLPAPVDTERLKPQRVSKKDYILFFGRLVERNGISTLVKAMKHIPEIRLKIAGDGELKSFLENYISQEKIENISLLGFLSREDLKREISNSNFTVFPNHCYHLCPSSILESFAFAKPVIGSNLGSVPELIEDGITGLLFEPKNEKELAQKIRYLCENPKVVKEMGRNARRKVEENYSAERYYPRLLGLYERLIEKKRDKNYPRELIVDKPVEEVSCV